jgi:hypothetical protein
MQHKRIYCSVNLLIGTKIKHKVSRKRYFKTIITHIVLKIITCHFIFFSDLNINLLHIQTYVDRNCQYYSAANKLIFILFSKYTPRR